MEMRSRQANRDRESESQCVSSPFLAHLSSRRTRRAAYWHALGVPSTDGSGDEGVCGVRSQEGAWMAMVPSDEKVVKTMRPIAQRIREAGPPRQVCGAGSRVVLVAEEES
jgi:hypothetical protein